MSNTKLHDYDRIAGDSYVTIEADRLVPLLNQFFPVSGRVHEPAEGGGHLTRELAKLPDVSGVIETDIQTGTPIEALDGSIKPDWVCSNLPFKGQDALIWHLLNIYPQAWHAYLVRWNYLPPKKRHSVIHANPRFAGTVVCSKRPRWVENSTGSPAVDYCWAVWSPIGAPVTTPTIHFEGAAQ